MKKSLLLSLFTLSIFLTFSSAFAAKAPCKELESCVRIVGELTGKSYLYTMELKGKVKMAGNFKLTKGSADGFISRVLNLNGYTRIPTAKDDGYLIISARDVRYTPTTVISASKDVKPELPDNYDYYQMFYRPKEADEIQLREFTRSIRPFLSRYGRVIAPKNENFLLLQDTAANLKRIYKLLVQYDRELSKEEKKRRKKWRDRDYEINKIRAKNCTSTKEIIKKYVKSND